MKVLKILFFVSLLFVGSSQCNSDNSKIALNYFYSFLDGLNIFAQKYDDANPIMVECVTCKRQIELGEFAGGIVAQLLLYSENQEGQFSYFEPYVKTCIIFLQECTLKQAKQFLLNNANDVPFVCPACQGTLWVAVN